MTPPITEILLTAIAATTGAGLGVVLAALVLGAWREARQARAQHLLESHAVIRALRGGR